MTENSQTDTSHATSLLFNAKNMSNDDAVLMLARSLPDHIGKFSVMDDGVLGRVVRLNAAVAAFLSGLVPASDSTELERRELNAWVCGMACDQDMPDSTVHILLLRARSLREREIRVESRESALSRERKQLDIRTSKLFAMEADILRVATRQADIVSDRRRIVELEEQLSEARVTRARVVRSFVACRDKLKDFHRAIVDSRMRSDCLDTLMGRVSHAHRSGCTYNYILDDLSPPERLKRLSSQLEDMSSARVLWEICEEWRRGAFGRSQVDQAIWHISFLLDILWTDGGVSNALRPSDEHLYGWRIGSARPSTYLMWSKGVSKRYERPQKS